MRSRFLIGAGAWLLGALSATGGSMLAVSHLANGLLGPGSTQLTPTVVSDDLASYQHASPGQTGSPLAGSIHRGSSSMRGDSTALTPAGTLLVSSAGTVTATCQSGLAYLLYWTPYQGFQVDDVARGPGAQASLVFDGTGLGVRIKVTCSGSVPVAQLSAPPVADKSGLRRDE